MQNMEPKLLAEHLTPAEWRSRTRSWPGARRAMATCSPHWLPPAPSTHCGNTVSGHAFISNADNLGATPDPRDRGLDGPSTTYRSGWRSAGGTRSDRKGGHVAVRKSDGRLILRDSAQVAATEDEAAFKTSRGTETFNTNNLWIDLGPAGPSLMDGHDGDPRAADHRGTARPSTPPTRRRRRLIQLETGDGHRRSRPSRARRAVLVDRSRFKPVKTTNDLLVLRSDVVRAGPDGDLTTTHEGDESRTSISTPGLQVLARLRHPVPGRAAVAGPGRPARGAR